MKKIILLTTLITITNVSLAETKITVSGISSGAYMAQQFHTAFSSQVEGAGIVAGGPYYCAQGKVSDALLKCMKTDLGVPSVSDSLVEAKKQYNDKQIDNPANIGASRVYVLSGTKDGTVLQKVSDVNVEVYKQWGVQGNALKYENTMAVGHAFPTDNFGNTCSTPSQSPYISNCKRDIAGEMLTHLLGKLEPKKAANDKRIFTFDQFESAPKNNDKLSMQKIGYAYIPESCELPEAAGCRIHVAFHGCQQTLDDIQTTFITKAGYNEWAETNKIVVMYPQIKKMSAGNPNGCWDWWGYSGANYHTKEGGQMKLVMKLVEALRTGALQLKKANL